MHGRRVSTVSSGKRTTGENLAPRAAREPDDRLLRVSEPAGRV